MNKVILMGRLTKNPEIRYTQGNEPVAVATVVLAVRRRFKKQGEADIDFFICKAFQHNAQFFEKYFRKGLMCAVICHLRQSSWAGEDGKKKYSTEIIVDEIYFAGSAKAAEEGTTAKAEETPEGFSETADADDDCPF